MLFEQVASIRLGDEARTRQLRHRYLALLLDAVHTLRTPGSRDLRRPGGRSPSAGSPRLDQRLDAVEHGLQAELEVGVLALVEHPGRGDLPQQRVAVVPYGRLQARYSSPCPCADTGG
jgi:hypothetical protein